MKEMLRFFSYPPSMKVVSERTWSVQLLPVRNHYFLVITSRMALLILCLPNNLYFIFSKVMGRHRRVLLLGLSIFRIEITLACLSVWGNWPFSSLLMNSAVAIF